MLFRTLTKRQRTLAGCSVCLLVSLLYLFSYFGNWFRVEHALIHGYYWLDEQQRPARNENGTKRILLWVPFFGRRDFYFGLGGAPFRTHLCPVSNCETTTDRALLASSDAVVFHFRDVDTADMPKWRAPWQRWVFHLLESPSYTSSADALRRHNSLFNWTMTYRLDSDVTARYGRVLERMDATEEEEEENKEQQQQKNGMMDVAATSADVLERRAPVVWLVSHCRTVNRREEYVRELQKHIKVDIYGRCGHRCAGDACELALYRNYKFFLSFENSNCRDYVTEKFFKALKYGIVPVVYGGANYTALAPPLSFINVQDFQSPRHLAEHLLRLDRSPAEYDQYLQWRSNFSVHTDTASYSFCDLCQRLHEDGEPKVYEDLYDWWMVKGNCKPAVGSASLIDGNKI